MSLFSKVTLLLNLKSSTMETKFLIFPCVLTSEDITILKNVYQDFSELIIKLDSISELKPKFDKVRLTLVLFDLRELFLNENISGYRWNSYCLNMVIVKLTYHLSLLENNLELFYNGIMYEVNSVITAISQVLAAKYYEWQNVAE